jgi:hypothetical protein
MQPWRYLPHAVAATFAVAILPGIAVLWLEAAGHVESLLLSGLIGVALSLAVSAIGSTLWRKRFGAHDVVFADLMLWGWVRRLLIERRLARTAYRLRLGGTDDLAHPSPLPPERQAEMLQELASALELRDPYTHGHTRRVTKHAYMIAKAMGLPPEEVDEIKVAAGVHDVGKVDIPLEILNKAGRLTDEEFGEIKQHALRGAELVARIGNQKITAMVRHHHERLDGTGYPDRLSASQIPLGARIIAVADTFDAITSTRAYRRACTHNKAIEILKKESGTQLDRDAVTAFLAYYSGRNRLAWWTSASTLPQRLIASLVLWFRGPGVARLVQGAAAIVTAGAIAGAGGAGVPTIQDRQQAVGAEVISNMELPRTTSDTSDAGAGDGTERSSKRESRDEGGSETQDPGNGAETDVGEDNTSSPGDGAGDSGGSGSDTGSSTGGTGGGGGTGGSGGTVGDVTDTVGDTVGDVEDTVDDTVDDVEDTVGDITDTVGDVLGDPLP